MKDNGVPKPRRRKRLKCRCNGQCTRWRKLFGPAKKKQLLKGLATAIQKKAAVDAKRRKKGLVVCLTRTVEWPATGVGQDRSKTLFMLALGLTPKPILDKKSRIPSVRLQRLSSAQREEAEATTERRLKELLHQKKMAERARRRRLIDQRRKQNALREPPQVVNLVSSEEEDDNNGTEVIDLISDEETEDIIVPKSPIQHHNAPRSRQYVCVFRDEGLPGIPKLYRKVVNPPPPRPAILSLLRHRTMILPNDPIRYPLNARGYEPWF